MINKLSSSCRVLFAKREGGFTSSGLHLIQAAFAAPLLANTASVWNAKETTIPVGSTDMGDGGKRELMNKIEDVLHPERILDEIVVFDPACDEVHRIDEGKWIKTRTSDAMRIDHATHGRGQTHAHIYGRKGNELGVVNLNGTGSHGTKMRLSSDQADILRKNGFSIRADRIVEWVIRPEWSRKLLLG